MFLTIITLQPFTIFFLSLPRLITLAPRSLSLECVAGTSTLALPGNDGTSDVCRGTRGNIEMLKLAANGLSANERVYEKMIWLFPEREITENG